MVESGLKRGVWGMAFAGIAWSSLVFLGIAGSGAPAWAQKTDALAPSSAPVQEYRFEPLRIDGAGRGPDTLIESSAHKAAQRPLARFKRSFVRRVLATAEAPVLPSSR